MTPRRRLTPHYHQHLKPADSDCAYTSLQSLMAAPYAECALGSLHALEDRSNPPLGWAVEIGHHLTGMMWCKLILAFTLILIFSGHVVPFSHEVRSGSRL